MMNIRKLKTAELRTKFKIGRDLGQINESDFKIISDFKSQLRSDKEIVLKYSKGQKITVELNCLIIDKFVVYEKTTIDINHRSNTRVFKLLLSELDSKAA